MSPTQNKQRIESRGDSPCHISVETISNYEHLSWAYVEKFDRESEQGRMRFADCLRLNLDGSLDSRHETAIARGQPARRRDRQIGVGGNPHGTLRDPECHFRQVPPTDIRSRTLDDRPDGQSLSLGDIEWPKAGLGEGDRYARSADGEDGCPWFQTCSQKHGGCLGTCDDLPPRTEQAECP